MQHTYTDTRILTTRRNADPRSHTLCDKTLIPKWQKTETKRKMSDRWVVYLRSAERYGTYRRPSLLAATRYQTALCRDRCQLNPCSGATQHTPCVCRRVVYLVPTFMVTTSLSLPNPDWHSISSNRRTPNIFLYSLIGVDWNTSNTLDLSRSRG